MTPARFNFARDVVERQDSGRLALRYCDTAGAVRDLTFGEVGEHAARWTRLLRSRGLSAGDRMLVLIGKTPDWLAVMATGIKVGAVTIPCSEMLRAKDLDFRARHSGATLLVADSGSRSEVEAMSESPDVIYVGETELGDPRPEYRHHRRRRQRVHSLHIRHDEGSEGSRASLLLRTSLAAPARFPLRDVRAPTNVQGLRVAS